MSRHARIMSEKRVYHIMMRGNNKESIFIDDQDKARIIEILADKKQEGEYKLFAFCIMDNHIHLVIQEGKDQLSRIIKRIGTSYAYYFNKKYKRIGHVFQDRYRSECIEDDSYLLSVIRYIHKNPLNAGISTIEGYHWSSYREYLSEKGRITDTCEVLGIISSDRKKAVKEFARFNNEATEEIFLDVAEVKEIDDIHAEEYIKEFLKERKINLIDLHNKDNHQHRDELIRLLLEKSNLSRRRIAVLLGLGRETVRKLSKEPSPVTCMNKVIDILKISNYDKFKCIADKCRFTCCEGWDVVIDTDTYNKWNKENDKYSYILKNIRIKKCGSKTEYFINKETKEACPFLDKQGLCQIVKSHGEECLSLTCHMFPRIENIFEGKKELSLSCACPEVVELMGSTAGKINMVSENNTNIKSHLLELRIRETIINIINQEKFSLEDKLIISFEMLLNILENENLREDSLLEEIEKYKNREYIQKLIAMYQEIELNTDESIEEINYLFLDIIQNYKEVSILESLFKEISKYAENIKIESLSEKWYDYENLFEQYNQLIENCIVTMILSNCVSNDIKDMTISFQMIILEYLLVRHAVFLKYCMNKNKEIDTKNIKDYVVAFSRIIGNNTEAVIEFIRNGFGEAVLEIGYLCFITLF